VNTSKMATLPRLQYRGQYQKQLTSTSIIVYDTICSINLLVFGRFMAINVGDNRLPRRFRNFGSRKRHSKAFCLSRRLHLIRFSGGSNGFDFNFFSLAVTTTFQEGN